MIESDIFHVLKDIIPILARKEHGMSTLFTRMMKTLR